MCAGLRDALLITQRLTDRAAAMGIESDDAETDPQLAIQCALLELLRRSKLPKLKLRVRRHPAMTCDDPTAQPAPSSLLDSAQPPPTKSQSRAGLVQDAMPDDMDATSD